jgi:hypothetical protein
MRVMQSKTVKIIKDYSYTIKGDPSAPIGQIGGASREDITFSFKVGQIVEGYIFDLGKEIQVRVGNYSAIIPKENWELVNKEEIAKIQMEYALAKANENAQSKSPTKSGSSVFRKLAGAYNQNLIIAVVLVAGYFAYKKFKK